MRCTWVRFAPGVIELRPERTPRATWRPRLAALLLEATGTRWTIALSTAPGEPTSTRRAKPPTPPASTPPPPTRWCARFWMHSRGRSSAPCMTPLPDAYGLPRLLLEPRDDARRAGGPDFCPADADPADMMEDDL